ncbi:ROK family protein [Yoonia sp. R2331]|uniref:ROK family transcriptional regulator n=1 Tax=Yoonia sp. R2331 TaxID=3237238 RepID=UPI0034E43F61
MYDVLRQSNADDPLLPGCGPVLPTQDHDTSPLRQQVFEHIRAMGQVARTDIARALGISAGSVTALTAELITAGFLQEVVEKPRETGRGRPPVALSVVSGAGHVIGIKLSDERHSAVLTDFAGNTVADATLSTTLPRKSVAALLEEVSPLIDTLMSQTDMDITAVSAIGVGISGIVDHQTGAVPWSPLLTEPDADLGRLFAERLGCRVFVDNDANILTLAELWFGRGRTMTDFAVVTVEHGVGMGLVLGNRLFRGARGMGLELGHIKVQLDGALCRCGQRGCLEAYLADYALAREAATALDQVGTQTAAAALESLFAEAKAGNQAARTIFHRAGKYLSLGLANVIQLFDPALIILAGERMRYDYLYADDVLKEMHRLTLDTGRPRCEVAQHAWGDLVWARGATALALSAITADMIGAAAP